MRSTLISACIATVTIGLTPPIIHQAAHAMDALARGRLLASRRVGRDLVDALERGELDPEMGMPIRHVDALRAGLRPESGVRS